MILSKTVLEIIEISKAANNIILDIYQNYSKTDVVVKDDNSPLTAADLASNKLICDKLTALYPNIPILSEEAVPEDTPFESEYCWVVDPLDGTKEFINKNGQFTVNIALVKEGHPVLGVVSVPVTGDIYYGAEGIGAFRIRAGKTEPIHVSDKTSQLNFVGSKSHSSEKEAALIDAKQQLIESTVAAGSSLKGLMVAEGSADVYYRFGYTCEWDTCAMHCIVQEAGGILMQMDKIPMTYNRENHLNEKGFFIVNRKENIWV